jgi:hypothetical protein
MKRNKRLATEEVLRYSQTEEIARATVRRHYLRWRTNQTPPKGERCDNPDCKFFSENLEWNGKQLPLILDHVNGCNTDNTPKNLRLLCPNCDSQLSTRGGANKGRVEKSSGGFALVRPDGLKDHHLPAEPGALTLVGSTVQLTVSDNNKT